LGRRSLKKDVKKRAGKLAEKATRERSCTPQKDARLPKEEKEKKKALRIEGARGSWEKRGE